MMASSMHHSSSSAPPISVCLLVYNHERTLRAAIESVLAQDFGTFELIVSDDCSTDGCWQIIESLAQQDARIRPMRTSRNMGMAANANFAVSRAAAPYIALLHHDDVCAPNLLRRWYEVAERHPSVAFVSNAYCYDSDRVDYHPFEECTNGRRALTEHMLPNWGSYIRGTAFIRHSCWQEVGGMREEFGMLADVDLWMRLAARWDVGYVREPLIRVREYRPADYPEAYVRFSWSRSRLLYDIHGVNRREFFADRQLRQAFEMLSYRWKVSRDELFWLAYAVVRRRRDILLTSDQVANDYEFWIARKIRELLALSTRRIVAAT
jgi:glycosyltransferase involved in cell wall biosynthesis